MPSPHFVFTSSPTALTALLVIPGSVNYFYNLYGHWMAEALRTLGVQVDCVELGEVPEQTYDIAIFSNVAENVHALGEATGEMRIMALRRRVGTLIAFTADCIHTRWFQNNLALSRKFDVEVIFDVGFLPQNPVEVERAGLRYHFAFDGLLRSQVSPNLSPDEDVDCRMIPWANIGAQTQKRVELTDRLLGGVSSRGVIYLPGLSPVKEKGSPHLNYQQIDQILRKSRYYVWCSQHDYFYMECLRHRMAYLAGCVPIKVVSDAENLPDELPMRSSVLRESELVEYLCATSFSEARRAFREEYEAMPRLEEGMASLLHFLGLSSPSWTPQAVEPRFGCQQPIWSQEKQKLATNCTS